jgi:uncharacterized membrane protein YcaP (DUF421 family)
MKPQDIHFGDWLRILIGEVPPSFFIELLIRAIVVYMILLVSMRIMGKRMSSRLSRNELASLVSLAAAVGIPMLAPDRGMLPAFIIAIVLVSIQRLIARQSCKNEKFENFSQGKVSALVSDGVVDMKELKHAKLSHERVFAQLRSQGVLQLGTVGRFYMEANGTFTLISRKDPMPGLSVLPPVDQELRDYFKEHDDQKICVQCGFPQKPVGHPYPICPNCGTNKWITAVIEVKNSNQ